MSSAPVFTETRISPADIVTSTCNEWGVKRSLVIGPLRSKFLVQCRRAIAFRLHEWGLSLGDIGRELGGRDHSTIWSLLRGGKHKNRE